MWRQGYSEQIGKQGGRRWGRWGLAGLVALAVGALLLLAVPAGAIPLQSWDNQIPNVNLRFKVLAEFNNEAVLDKETQLVWEQSPVTTTMTWGGARHHCAQIAHGNRKGWRLPSFVELSSLLYPSQNNPALPPGHPFSNVQTAFFPFWSATTDAELTQDVWAVHFGSGDVDTLNKVDDVVYVWCVRGAMNADAY